MTNHPEQSHQIDRIIPMAEVAKIFNRSTRSLWRWYAKEKIIPKPLKVNGRAIGYRASTVEEILTSFQGGE
ncbi:AlpA family transcriptional regulator [Vibrio alginolyticus]|nr:AlpA family transcriptional regulator [Vibrio alginolyticus]